MWLEGATVERSTGCGICKEVKWINGRIVDVDCTHSCIGGIVEHLELFEVASCRTHTVGYYKMWSIYCLRNKETRAQDVRNEVKLQINTVPMASRYQTVELTVNFADFIVCGCAECEAMQ